MSLPADIPQPGTKWKHLRGNVFVVVGAAFSAHTLEWFVLYRSLQAPEDNDVLWTRPAAGWEEEVSLASGAYRGSLFTPYHEEEP